MQKPSDYIHTPVCDSLGVNGLAEVTVKTNFGYALITVATLGIWSPVKVQWRCGKPCKKPVPYKFFSMKLIDTGVREWENLHHSFKEQIKALYVAGNEPALDALESYNDVTRGFQNQLREAIKTNTPFRSLGGAWSFTKVATARDGMMIDTKTAQYFFDHYSGKRSARLYRRYQQPFIGSMWQQRVGTQ